MTIDRSKYSNYSEDRASVSLDVVQSTGLPWCTKAYPTYKIKADNQLRILPLNIDEDTFAMNTRRNLRSWGIHMWSWKLCGEYYLHPAAINSGVGKTVIEKRKSKLYTMYGTKNPTSGFTDWSSKDAEDEYKMIQGADKAFMLVIDEQPEDPALEGVIQTFFIHKGFFKAFEEYLGKVANQENANRATKDLTAEQREKGRVFFHLDHSIPFYFEYNATKYTASNFEFNFEGERAITDEELEQIPEIQTLLKILPIDEFTEIANKHLAGIPEELNAKRATEEEANKPEEASRERRARQNDDYDEAPRRRNIAAEPSSNPARRSTVDVEVITPVSRGRSVDVRQKLAPVESLNSEFDSFEDDEDSIDY